MLNYMRRRLGASIDSRVRAAITRQDTAEVSQAGAGMWNGEGDPFAFHTEAAIGAMSEAIAALYGYDVEGDIAEFGTMSGKTATGLARAIATCDSQMAHAAHVYRHRRRRLFMFDSFVGLPETVSDTVDGRSPHVQDGVWSAGACHGISMSELTSSIAAHLPQDRFEVVPGWFSDTVPALSPDTRFALLHIDSDLYSSAMDILDNLLGRGLVARGAYIFFDDWNCNRADPNFGERRAWRECVEKYGIKFSDAGHYGIFAKKFILHDYTGSPQQEKQAVTPEEVKPVAQPTPATTASKKTERATSTDVYDHQTASRGYHEATGIADMDPAFAPIYDRCRQYSMTSSDRLYAVYKAVQYLQQAGIEGDFVECGVWRGGSMMVAAETLKLFPGPNRTMHLFDTYEGLPEPTKEDVDVWGHSAKTWWVQKKTSVSSSDWARAHLDEVKSNMAQTGFPADKLFYVKGMVEDTIPEQAPKQIALLRLDTDWYASTKHEMEHLFPQLVRNGVIIIDDYGHFKGAKQAVDEYLASTKNPLMLMRIDYTGRIAIKTHG